MALPDNYREATTEKNCGNCAYIITRNNYCVKWKADVERDKVCNAWRPNQFVIKK